METKLARITEVAKTRPEEKFTSLFHHINEEMLMACHYELAGNKAPGVDKVTKEEYESNLAENLQKLVERLKQKSYRPQPVRRERRKEALYHRFWQTFTYITSWTCGLPQ